jgi:hypothetical protein
MLSGPPQYCAGAYDSFTAVGIFIQDFIPGMPGQFTEHRIIQ